MDNRKHFAIYMTVSVIGLVGAVALANHQKKKDYEENQSVRLRDFMKTAVPVQIRDVETGREVCFVAFYKPKNDGRTSRYPTVVTEVSCDKAGLVTNG